jgi:hypothetical protein
MMRGSTWGSAVVDYTQVPNLQQDVAYRDLILPSYLLSFVHYDYRPAFEEVSRNRLPGTREWISELPWVGRAMHWIASPVSLVLLETLNMLETRGGL